MKKILLAASAVALLAAAGCADKKGTSTAVSGADTVTVAASASVAYFNLDTLLTKYDMYIDMRSAYEEKVQKADAELTSKGRALERNVAITKRKFKMVWLPVLKHKPSRRTSTNNSRHSSAIVTKLWVRWPKRSKLC